MAATVFLVRHAAHDLVDQVLCGRMPGVHLGEAGRRQAVAVARRLAGAGLAGVYSSPLPRAHETAEAIAGASGGAVAIREELNEIDFGAWTGRRLAELGDDPHWRRWNTERDRERPPGGEAMREAQARAFNCLQRLTEAHPDAAIAAISHGDVIKSVVAAVLGLPLDGYARFDIDTASVTTIAFWHGGAKVLRMNEAVPA